jgi:phage repressor protein C with HTH and peptisase S24 domain
VRQKALEAPGRLAVAGDRESTMSHARIWSAIDAFAARLGLTPSGLARRAGLDATTFNRSKRHGNDGRPRWPSTESIAKILEATGTSLDDFFSLMADPQADRLPPVRSVPFLDLREASRPDLFDPIGLPVGDRWDEVAFPGGAADPLYALEVSGHDLLPLYRDGDVIIVSPTAQIRRGDRVIVRTLQGALIARVLVRRTARVVELDPIAAGGTREKLTAERVAWMARIVWASQ